MLINCKATCTLVFLFAVHLPAGLLAQVLDITTAPDSVDIAIDQLETVGTATLRVFFWDVYDSELLTQDGDYHGVEPGLALNLTYKRALTNQQLVAGTRKEWGKLSGPEFLVKQNWSTQLLGLWPNVEVNDEILLYVDSQLASHFYFNGNKLGVLTDSAFTEQFLAIWLSPETSYPKARAKLLNLSINNPP
jgi:hypothetical protein